MELIGIIKFNRYKVQNVCFTICRLHVCLEKLATCPATRDKLCVHMVGLVSKPMIGRISLSRNRVTNPTPILVWRIGWSSHVPVRDLGCPTWLLYWTVTIPSESYKIPWQIGLDSIFWEKFVLIVRRLASMSRLKMLPIHQTIYYLFTLIYF